MKKINKTAVIYARSATNEQSAIEMQIKSCQDYANENGIEVKKIFIEKVSYRDAYNQSSLKKTQKYLIEHKIDCLLVHRIDRISRNFEIVVAVEAFLAKKKIEFIRVSEMGTESSPSGKFIRTILLSTAQFDNEMKSQRVKDAMTEKFKSGDWMWAVPFGYTRTKRIFESEIQPKQNESDLVQKIFSMASEGALVEEIANKLPKDFASTISIKKIISNPFYKGYMKSSLVPELVEGNYSPLVTVSLWEKANNNIRN